MTIGVGSVGGTSTIPLSVVDSGAKALNGTDEGPDGNAAVGNSRDAQGGERLLGRGPASSPAVTTDTFSAILNSLTGGVYHALKPVVETGIQILAAAPKATGLVFEGSAADQKKLHQLVDQIRAAGPKGKAFIEALESSPTKTHLKIATSAEKKDGTVVSLAALSGGVTFRPSESKSGENEVYIDPTNLINYRADDGSTVKETPAGLLLHEMGHAKLLNDKDPAQTSGGPDAEKNVRKETNPIRSELGMKPEK